MENAIFPVVAEDQEALLPEVIQPSALEAMERASIDVQISTAKRYRRDNPKAIMARIMSAATMDKASAEACFYSLKRGDKPIQGASVRLAEIVRTHYGNSRCAARVVDNDGKFITAQGVFHDMENNVCVSVEVKRRITDKNGRTYSEDMQAVASNAACSIAARNAILSVVPKALWGPVYEQCRKVAIGGAKPIEQLRAEWLAQFAEMGVTQPQLLAHLGLERLDLIELEHIQHLVGVKNAIRDNETTLAEQFPPIAATARPTFAAKKKVGEEPAA